MKNNQFKKVIRKQIEWYCHQNDLVSVFLDETKNTRIFHFYDAFNWRWLGVVSVFINSDYVHLKFSNLKTLSLYQHIVKEVKADYKQFDKVMDTLGDIMEIIIKTEG